MTEPSSGGDEFDGVAESPFGSDADTSRAADEDAGFDDSEVDVAPATGQNVPDSHTADVQAGFTDGDLESGADPA